MGNLVSKISGTKRQEYEIVQAEGQDDDGAAGKSGGGEPVDSRQGPAAAEKKKVRKGANKHQKRKVEKLDFLKETSDQDQSEDKKSMEDSSKKS